jgi:hypothetical protein
MKFWNLRITVTTIKYGKLSTFACKFMELTDIETVIYWKMVVTFMA